MRILVDCWKRSRANLARTMLTLRFVAVAVPIAAWAQPPASAPSGATPYQIEAADVGTGLAVLVSGPGFTVLYDGGSNDDLSTGAGNRLVAFLRASHPGLHRIDHVILSHPHQDHVQLLADVIDQYEVGDVWDSGRLNPICGYRAFLSAIAQHPAIIYHDAIGDGGIHTAKFAAQTCNGKSLPAQTITLRRGAKVGTAVVSLGANAAMTFLHEDPQPYTDVNRNSLVTRIDLGSRRLLLMGDAGGGNRADPQSKPKTDSVEGQLLACCLAEIHADVMIVGHHGSETSSRLDFINAVGAHDFVVSVGPKAYSGTVLPDAVVIQELQNRGRLWRTDLHDAACGRAQKVGRDADGQPGGCDNVRITIDQNGVISAGYEGLVD